jgi:hypothetical protein
MIGYRAERRKLARLMGMDYMAFGIFGQFVAVVLLLAVPFDPGSHVVITAEFAFVLCTGVIIGGCTMFAAFNRISRVWALLGLFNLPGTLILLLLPLRGRRRTVGPGFSVIFAEPYRRDVWRMDVRVQLDENIGTGVREPIMLQLPRGANIGTALKTLAGVIPNLFDGDLPNTAFIVNGRPADRRDELSDGDQMIVKLALPPACPNGPIAPHEN